MFSNGNHLYHYYYYFFPPDDALSADSDDESLSSSSDGSSSSASSSSSSSSEDEEEEEGERADSDGLDTLDESTMDSTAERDRDRYGGGSSSLVDDIFLPAINSLSLAVFLRDIDTLAVSTSELKTGLSEIFIMTNQERSSRITVFYYRQKTHVNNNKQLKCCVNIEPKLTCD